MRFWSAVIQKLKEVIHKMIGAKTIEQTLHVMPTVSSAMEEAIQKWSDMYKAISTNRSIIVYTSRVNATIFPRKQLGDDLVQVIGMISTHMPPKKVKIRY